MITLKKSFELKNYLSGLLQEAINYLGDSEYLTKTVSTHYRKKVFSEAEDEIVEKPKPYDFDIDINTLLGFVMYLIGEIEKLTFAINEQKHWYVKDKDLDGMVSTNRMKRMVLNEIENMLALKSKERTTIGRATKFNENGEQVSYSYDVKEVTTIDFDRNFAKKLSRNLRTDTDILSDEIERMQINRELDFETIFTIGDSFDEAVETYLEEKKNR